MSKTIIITIHFPILFIIIISLFTFYLSFIFCAITLINSILKKIPFFSSIYLQQFFVFNLFKVLLIYDDMMIIENIKQPLSHFQQKSDWRTTETILLNKKSVCNLNTNPKFNSNASVHFKYKY